MARALKIAGLVLGAVAVVATAGAALGVMMGGTMMLAGVGSAASIASIAGGAAAVVSSVAQAIAKPPPARGSVSQLVISADAPQPYVMGEGYTGGVLRHRTAYGGRVSKVHNPYLFDAVVYSGGGPVQSISPRVDIGPITNYYSARLAVTMQLGACPEPAALAPLWVGATGWSSEHKLSGQAAIGWSFKFDKDGEIFASGLPVTGAYGQWAKVYDPRLDSTQPGGSGPQRLGDEATYSYSDSPALHAGTYAFGRYQNGKRTLGMGLPADAIDWEVIAAWANTCQANGWRIFGVVYEPADRWANLTDICAAGGAEPIPGARLSFRYQAPRVALDTITESDIADETSSVCAMQSYRDRVNVVVPKRIFPENSWELMSDQAVGVAAYIEADGEERPREWPFNFVKASKQARELAAYKLTDTRELFPIELVCIPRLRGYRAGDCLRLNLPQLGLDHDAIILHREIEPGTGKVRLTLISESTGKHAFALGQAGSAPPVASLAQTGQDRDNTAWRPPSWADVVDDDPAHPKPEDGATVGAPSGTDVGGVPADKLVQDLAQLDRDIETAGREIADLQTAFSTTVNAASSAAAAKAARDLAVEAKTDAQAAADAADEARASAVAKASEAAGSAGVAAGHASTASTKADQAGGSASAAAGSASVASTRAGEASTYAANAATSSTTAEGHKNAAASSAGVSASAKDAAVSAARSLLPAAISPEILTTGTVFGSPETRPPIDASRIVGGVFTSTEATITTIQVLPWVQGRIYEVTAVVEGLGVPSASGGYFERLNPNYSRLTTHGIAGNVPHYVDGVKKTVAYRLGCGVGGTGIINVAECQHLRAAVLVNRELTSAVQVAGASTKLYAFVIKDVTASVQAEAAASAASTSASSASASASTAGSHASTATTQASVASTKAGEASTHATSAATSSSTAEGHKNAAATSAGVAANHAGTAEDAASAAATSASTAGTKATEAGNAATAAATSLVQANQAKDAAASSASVATGAASTATGAAAAASLSASLSASVGQGALNKNAGFDDYPSDAVGAFPAGWALWVGTAHYRVPDPQGGFAVRVPAAGGGNVGIQQNLGDEQLLTQNGYYVIEADVFLHTGTFAGAGVLLAVRSQTNAALGNLFLHFNSEADISGAVQSAPTPGRAYAFRKLVQLTGADPRGFILYAMTRHQSFDGGNGTAGDIEWRKLLVRPATQAEIRDQTVLEPMAATVTNQADAIQTINSSLASQGTTLNSLGVTVSTQASALTTVQNGVTTVLGQVGFNVNADGRVSGMKHFANGDVSKTVFETDQFGVCPPGGTGNGLYIESDAQGRSRLRIRDGSVNVIELGWVS